MIDPAPIRDRFSALSPHLNERERRLLAATEATAAGYGGIVAVSQATGVAASTIGRGLKELAGEAAIALGRVRRSGGGRKPLTVTNPALLTDLLALVEPAERGDPMSPLRWTCKSLRQLAAELTARGHRISRTVVGELLKRQKFSLQANSKTQEGGDHPDRDAQFIHINQSVTAALAAQQPVISVDTKKKELIGEFKNAGREWRPQGEPEEVGVYDFLSKALGRAVPYGIYDIAANAGWVSVGMNHDTSAFAVQAFASRCASASKRRGADRAALVARHWSHAISRHQVSDDHLRRRWQQWLSCAAVETRIARPRRRTWHRHHGPPPAAGHQQVEQNRAPPVLIHQHELASQATCQLSRHC
jgi:hypothetical protein